MSYKQNFLNIPSTVVETNDLYKLQSLRRILKNPLFLNTRNFKRKVSFFTISCLCENIQIFKCSEQEDLNWQEIWRTSIHLFKFRWNDHSINNFPLMYRYGINTNVLYLTCDFSSSCFIADDTQVQIVWLHVAVFSKHDIFNFWDNIHLFKYYPV